MQNPFQYIHDVLDYSGQEAYRLLGNQVNTEHLMLGILHCKNRLVSDIFEHFGINTDVLRSTLYDSQEQAVAHATDTGTPEQGDSKTIVYDKETSEVISEAIIEARRCNGKSALVQPEHLLLAILKKEKCDPAKLLITQGLTYEKLFNYINGINQDMDDKLNKLNQEVENYKRSHTPDEEEQETDEEEQETDEEQETVDAYDGAASAKDEQETWMDPDEEPIDFSEEPQLAGARRHTKSEPNIIGAGRKTTKSNTPFLDKFSFDLTQAAKKGELDPVVGRDKEITRLMEILGRRKKNNPVLIGEPGVGKSAIVEGLAQLIANGDQSSLFFNKRILSLDMTGIVAGCIRWRCIPTIGAMAWDRRWCAMPNRR